MSGWIGVGVKLNDGDELYLNGYTRSAYDIWAYKGLLDGDDTGARDFAKKWNDGNDDVPPHLIRSEYNSFFVDFPRRRIVTHGDNDINIASTELRIHSIAGPFTDDLVAAGRVKLVWTKGEKPDLEVTPEFVKAYQKAYLATGPVESRKVPGYDLSFMDIIGYGVEVHYDLSPFQVVMYPQTNEGMAAYLADAVAGGLKVDPKYGVCDEDEDLDY